MEVLFWANHYNCKCTNRSHANDPRNVAGQEGERRDTHTHTHTHTHTGEHTGTGTRMLHIPFIDLPLKKCPNLVRGPHSSYQRVVQGKCPLHFLNLNGVVCSNTLFSNTSALTSSLLFGVNSTCKILEHLVCSNTSGFQFWGPLARTNFFVGTVRPSHLVLSITSTQIIPTDHDLSTLKSQRIFAICDCDAYRRPKNCSDFRDKRKGVCAHSRPRRDPWATAIVSVWSLLVQLQPSV